MVNYGDEWDFVSLEELKADLYDFDQTLANWHVRVSCDENNPELANRILSVVNEFRQKFSHFLPTGTRQTCPGCLCWTDECECEKEEENHG